MCMDGYLRIGPSLLLVTLTINFEQYGSAFMRMSVGKITRPVGVIRSTPFQKWFNGSKATCPAGLPLVFYHGTDATFSAFNQDKAWRSGGDDAGFYFSPNASVAQQYGANVLECYLAVKNPKYVSQDEIEYLSFADKAELEAKGFDGLIARDERSGITEVVVFSPSQIKSATANNGSFDPANPDITK